MAKSKTIKALEEGFRQFRDGYNDQRTDTKTFNRSKRIYGAPLTDEARDWAVNNAQRKSRSARQRKEMNPVKRKTLETKSPVTRHNEHRPAYLHSSENEARLNANNMGEYNVSLNRVTARNKLLYSSKEKTKKK